MIGYGVIYGAMSCPMAQTIFEYKKLAFLVPEELPCLKNWRDLSLPHHTAQLYPLLSARRRTGRRWPPAKTCSEQHSIFESQKS